MAPVVELIAARKRFGNVEAVRGVDLAIAAGEVVALLGPNGAGKTTSISLMLGLRQPTSGEARLFGLLPERSPGAQPVRRHAPGVGRHRGAQGRRDRRPVPALLPRPAAHRAGARAVRPHRQGGELHRPALGRRAPAALLRARHLRRPRGAVPRRAERGHGRDRAPRDGRDHPRLRGRRQDHRADHALPGRGRSARPPHRGHRSRRRHRRRPAAADQGPGRQQARELQHHAAADRRRPARAACPPAGARRRARAPAQRRARAAAPAAVRAGRARARAGGGRRRPGGSVHQPRPAARRSRP